MAIACFQEKTKNRKTRFYATLLDSVATQDNSEWMDVAGIFPFTIHVTGIADATLQLRSSNATERPPNASQDVQLGSDISADGIYSVTVPMRWFKTIVSSYTSGDITAYFEGAG